jgi:hypothetical protein
LDASDRYSNRDTLRLEFDLSSIEIDLYVIEKEPVKKLIEALEKLKYE